MRRTPHWLFFSLLLPSEKGDAAAVGALIVEAPSPHSLRASNEIRLFRQVSNQIWLGSRAFSATRLSKSSKFAQTCG